MAKSWAEMNDAEKLAARVRWHAELGVNALDKFEGEDALWHARFRLQAISQILDDFDHANSLADIFRVTGVEARFNRKGR